MKSVVYLKHTGPLSTQALHLLAQLTQPELDSTFEVVYVDNDVFPQGIRGAPTLVYAAERGRPPQVLIKSECVTQIAQMVHALISQRPAAVQRHHGPPQAQQGGHHRQQQQQQQQYQHQQHHQHHIEASAAPAPIPAGRSVGMSAAIGSIGARGVLFDESSLFVKNVMDGANPNSGPEVASRASQNKISTEEIDRMMAQRQSMMRQ